MKIGVLASGAGTNLQAIIDRVESGILDASIEIVLTNRPEAAAVERARRHGIPGQVIERSSFATRKEYDAALVEILKEKGCEAIVLAGYMLVLGKAFISAFPMRILNIHPALLPSFPGTDGVANSLAYGVKLTGPTVHFVAEEVDSGPIVIQAALPAEGDVSALRHSIHALEHRIFPQAIQWLAEGRLTVEGRQVHLASSSRKQIRPDGNWLVWPPLEEGF